MKLNISKMGLMGLLYLGMILPVFSQTVTNVSVNGAGWKRIAVVNASKGRGFGRVSVYTTGGSYTPIVSNIDWFHDWGTIAGISIHSDSRNSAYWTEARITDDDGTHAYIEVNFAREITGNLSVISDEYGWNPAQPYSGVLPDGGGSVRASAEIGRLNIGDYLMVTHTGLVGVGTANPTEKLSVKGKIRAQEIKVETANWADYVFRKDYQLPALSEIESYIQEYQHLPGIPSEEEVKRDGVSLGEMNKKLLEKVEELTLMLIENEKKRNSLAEQVQEQESKIKYLEQFITK